MHEYDALPRVDFPAALSAAKAGRRIARVGWNGTGMWVVLWAGGSFPPDHDIVWETPQLRKYAAGRAVVQAPLVHVEPCLVCKLPGGSLVFGWVAHQSDQLADDWVVLPDL